MLPQPVCNQARKMFTRNPDIAIRTTTDNVVVSDILAPPQHRAVGEDAGTDLGVAKAR